MLRPLALLLAMGYFFGGCGPDKEPPAPAPSIPFVIHGQLSFVRGDQVLKTIDIEVADSDSTRARGLMHRSEIPLDTGMLFIFPAAESQAFYMMNTPRSLDIQFYASDSTLINIAEDTTPFSLDNLISEGPTQFVVEVPAGYSRRIGLVPGDKIRWTRNNEVPAADTSATATP